MPFANHARMISAGLQMFGHMITCSVEAIEDRYSVEMGVLTSQQSRAARCANRVGNKRLGKPSTTLRKAINVGCLIYLGSISRNRVLGMVIGEDEQNIGLSVLFAVSD